MLFNFTQWERLQECVSVSKDWFKENGLFKQGLPTFEKIAESTLHELSQIRKFDDWYTFLEDIPEENRLPPRLIVNFVNCINVIDWPDSERTKFLKELKDNIATETEYSKIWIVHHNLFAIDRYYKTFIDYNPNKYGGIVLISTNVCDKDGNDTGKDTWGIMCSNRNYVPISVDF